MNKIKLSNVWENFGSFQKRLIDNDLRQELIEINTAFWKNEIKLVVEYFLEIIKKYVGIFDYEIVEANEIILKFESNFDLFFKKISTNINLNLTLTVN